MSSLAAGAISPYRLVPASAVEEGERSLASAKAGDVGSDQAGGAAHLGHTRNMRRKRDLRMGVQPRAFDWRFGIGHIEHGRVEGTALDRCNQVTFVGEHRAPADVHED